MQGIEQKSALERVRDITAEYTGLDRSQIRGDTTFILDLGLDNLELAELQFDLEKESREHLKNHR